LASQTNWRQPARQSPDICTHLRRRGTDVGVIRELAGHADIRTTTIYTAVDDARLEHAIAERGRQNRGARRAAAGARARAADTTIGDGAHADGRALLLRLSAVAPDRNAAVPL
jgi:hypothetical protein